MWRGHRAMANTALNALNTTRIKYTADRCSSTQHAVITQCDNTVYHHYIIHISYSLTNVTHSFLTTLRENMYNGKIKSIIIIKMWRDE